MQLTPYFLSHVQLWWFDCNFELKKIEAINGLNKAKFICKDVTIIQSYTFNCWETLFIFSQVAFKMLKINGHEETVLALKHCPTRIDNAHVSSWIIKLFYDWCFSSLFLLKIGYFCSFLLFLFFLLMFLILNLWFWPMETWPWTRARFPEYLFLSWFFFYITLHSTLCFYEFSQNLS